MGVLPYYNVCLKDEPNILIDIVKCVGSGSNLYFLRKNGFVYKMDTNYFFTLCYKNYIDIIPWNNGDVIGINFSLHPVINTDELDIEVYTIIPCNNIIYGITKKYQIIKINKKIIETCFQLSHPYKILSNHSSCNSYNTLVVLSAGIISIMLHDSIHEISDYKCNDIYLVNNNIYGMRYIRPPPFVDIPTIDYDGVFLNLLNIKLSKHFYINNTSYVNVNINNDNYLVLQHGVYLLNNMGLYNYIEYFSVDGDQYKFLNNRLECEYVDTCPYDIELELIEVYELSPANTIVGFFITSDTTNSMVKSKTYNYEILSYDHNRFYIDGNSLKIINNISDLEAENFYYKIKVKSTDKYGFGYVKQFEFKLNIRPIDNIKTSIAFSNIYFTRGSFIVSKLSISSNVFRGIVSENIFRFSKNTISDNDLFNIHNNKFIITNSKADYSKKIEYTLCLEAVNMAGEIIVHPKIYRIFYDTLDNTINTVIITRDTIFADYNNLYVGTIIKIGDLSNYTNTLFKLNTHIDIFKLCGQELYLRDYAIDFMADKYTLNISHGEFYDYEINIYIKDRVDKSLHVDISECKYYDGSNIDIVGQIIVTNVYDGYSISFSNTYDGIKVENANSSFDIINIGEHSYKLVCVKPILCNALVIIKIVKQVSAVTSHYKIPIHYVCDDNSIKISGNSILEGTGNGVLCSVSDGVQLVDSLGIVPILSDNKYFKIVDNNLIISSVVYLPTNTHFDVVLASSSFIHKYTIYVERSPYRPSSISLDNLILKYDSNYVCKLSLPGLDIINYNILLDNEYFSVIDGSIYRKSVLTSDLECNIYVEYKCDANLNYSEKFKFSFETVVIPNIFYTNNENLLDIVLSNYCFSPDNNVVGELTTTSKIIFGNYIYFMDRDYYDNDYFTIIDNRLTFIGSLTDVTKTRYNITIKSFVNSDNYIEKSFIIDKNTSISYKKIETHTNIILSRTLVGHDSGDNYLVGFVKCVDVGHYNKDNNFGGEFILADSDIEQLDNSYFVIENDQLILLKSSNYFTRDKYKIRICTTNMKYFRTFIIMVDKPKTSVTNYCNLDEDYPDNIIVTSTIISKSHDLVCYLYAVSCGNILSGYSFKLANHVDFFNIVDGNRLVINAENKEYISQPHYRLTIITWLDNKFHERDVLFTLKDNYEFRILLNKSIIKYPVDPKANVGYMLGKLSVDGVENRTIFNDEKSWQYTLLGMSSYSITDDVIYVSRKPLDDSFLVVGKNKRLDHEFTIETKIELDFIEGNIEMIDVNILDHTVKQTSTTFYFNLVYKDKGLMLTMPQISDPDNSFVYYGSKSIDHKTKIDIRKSSMFKFVCTNINRDYFCEFNLVDQKTDVVVRRFNLYICIYDRYYLDKRLLSNKLVVSFKNTIINSLEVKQYKIEIVNGINISTSETDGFTLTIHYSPQTKFLAKTTYSVYLLLNTYIINNGYYFYFDIIDNNGVSIIKNEIFTIYILAPALLNNSVGSGNNLCIRRVSYVTDGYDYFYKKLEKMSSISRVIESKYIFNTSINGLFYISSN
jgi:hypothetical protein